jgi:hypothetical protein
MEQCNWNVLQSDTTADFYYCYYYENTLALALLLEGFVDTVFTLDNNPPLYSAACIIAQ